MAEKASHPFPARAVLVTLGACGAFVALGFIPVRGASAMPAGKPLFTFGSLGLRPVIAAFILVELAAVAIPGLRPLRKTAEGRARLAATSSMLAVAVAALQAYGILRYAGAVHLFDQASVFRPQSFDPRVVVPASLIGGVLMTMMLARVIDVAGIGAGYSMLLAAAIGTSVLDAFVKLVRETDTEPLLRYVLVLAIFAAAAFRMLAAKPVAGRYRLPVSGLEPVHQGVMFAVVALQSGFARSFFWPWVPASIAAEWVYRGAQILLTFFLCTVFARLFHRSPHPDDAAALEKATLASTLWLLGLTAGTWIVERVANVPLTIDAFVVVALIAVGMDLFVEIRARIERGSQRVLRVFHRLEDADSLCGALATAEIDAALRGARHRALYQFFAPFIPISVLVAEADAERAEVVTVEHARALEAPPPLETAQAIPAI